MLFLENMTFVINFLWIDFHQSLKVIAYTKKLLRSTVKPLAFNPLGTPSIEYSLNLVTLYGEWGVLAGACWLYIRLSINLLYYLTEIWSEKYLTKHFGFLFLAVKWILQRSIAPISKKMHCMSHVKKCIDLDITDRNSCAIYVMP